MLPTAPPGHPALNVSSRRAPSGRVLANPRRRKQEGVHGTLTHQSRDRCLFPFCAWKSLLATSRPADILLVSSGFAGKDPGPSGRLSNRPARLAKSGFGIELMRYQLVRIVLLAAASTLSAGPTARDEKTRVPAKSTSALSSSNPYRAAGLARRASEIETWMFIHPTWINWRPCHYTSQEARELIDGYLLIMADRPGCRPPDAAQAASWILKCGMRFIPGMRLAPRRDYREWTSPAAWKRELEFYDRIREYFRLEGSPLAIDAEPCWAGEPRYPKPDDVYGMMQAMGRWAEIARETELWILPGGVHYWNSWVLGSLRSHHGLVYMLDEATYSRRGGNEAELEAMICQRAAFMKALNMEYVPGFYLCHAIDPALYETLKRCGIRRCWFFPRAIEDEWEWFGTPRWKHGRPRATTRSASLR